MALSKAKYPCFVCMDGRTPETGTCNRCGQAYRRGYMVKSEKEGPRVGGRPQSARAGLERALKRILQPVIDLEHLPFTHFAVAPTKEAAIEATFDEYDRFKGKRRKPSRQAFEVVMVKKIGGAEGFWRVYMRKRK